MRRKKKWGMNMLKNKTRSKFRLIFSSLALIAFVVFSLCDNLMVTEHTSYYTCAWRLNLINDLFLLFPFVALLVFAVLERKLEYVNGRAYVAGIFALNAIQALFIFLGDSTSDFSFFTCSFIGVISDVAIPFVIVRFIILLFIPIADKIMIKLYSLEMIAFFVIIPTALFVTGDLNIRNMHGSMIKFVVAVIADILFHIALFFFSDLLDKRNESDAWLCFLTPLIYPIFGNMFDDEDEECFEEISSDSYNNEHINYKKEGRNRFNMINYCEYFSEDVLKEIDVLEIGGENFLIDPPEDAMLRFDLERQDAATTVSGSFTYTFTEEQAAKSLKKKSVLNKTFDDILLDAEADADIGVESIEEGKFVITLVAKTFNTEDGCEQVRSYMIGFMKAINIIQNTESYE